MILSGKPPKLLWIALRDPSSVRLRLPPSPTRGEGDAPPTIWNYAAVGEKGVASASRRAGGGAGAEGLGGEGVGCGSGPWGRHRQDGGAGEA